MPIDPDILTGVGIATQGVQAIGNWTAQNQTNANNMGFANYMYKKQRKE